MAQPEYGAEIAGIYSKLENKKVESPKCFSLHHNLRSICEVTLTILIWYEVVNARFTTIINLPKVFGVLEDLTKSIAHSSQPHEVGANTINKGFTDACLRDE
jgi:hypothetical protein